MSKSKQKAPVQQRDRELAVQDQGPAELDNSVVDAQLQQQPVQSDPGPGLLGHAANEMGDASFGELEELAGEDGVGLEGGGGGGLQLAEPPADAEPADPADAPLPPPLPGAGVTADQVREDRDNEVQASATRGQAALAGYREEVGPKKYTQEMGYADGRRSLLGKNDSAKTAKAKRQKDERAGNILGRMVGPVDVETSTKFDHDLRMFMTTEWNKGAMRAEGHADTLKELLGKLDADIAVATSAKERLEAQIEVLQHVHAVNQRPGGPTKADYKEVENAKKAWRWDNVAENANRANQTDAMNANGLDLARGALATINQRLAELQGWRQEVQEARGASKGAKERVAENKDGESDTQRSERKDIQSIASSVKKVNEVYDRDLAGDRHGFRSVSATFTGGGRVPGMAAAGSLGVSKDTERGDDTSLNESKTASGRVGGSMGLNKLVSAGGGANASVKHNKSYRSAEDAALHKTLGQHSPEQLDRAKALMGEANAEQIGRREEHADAPAESVTVTVGGDASADVGPLGLAVSGSHSDTTHIRPDQERKSTKEVGSASASFGGLTADVTFTQIDNHSVADNNGSYATVSLGLSSDVLSFSSTVDLGLIIQNVQQVTAAKLTGYVTVPGRGPKATAEAIALILQEAIGQAIAQVFAEATKQIPAQALDGAKNLLLNGVGISGGGGTQQAIMQNYVVQSSGAVALQYNRLTGGKWGGVAVDAQVGATPGFVALALQFKQNYTLSESLGQHTLTYVQTVYNGLSGAWEGAADWASFKEQHGTDLNAMMANIGGDEQNRLQRELADVGSDLREKLAVAQACPDGAPLVAPLGAALAGLSGFLDGPGTQTMEAYFDSIRALSSVEDETFTIVNERAEREGQERAFGPRVFLNQYYGGVGAKYGWVLKS